MGERLARPRQSPLATRPGLPSFSPVGSLPLRGGLLVAPRVTRRSGLGRPRTTRFLSLREASSFAHGLRPSRSGGASSAALRPACACDRAGRPAVGPLAVLLPRRDPRSEPSTPHRGTPARDPHAPAKSAFAPWAVLATHPRAWWRRCWLPSAWPGASTCSRTSDMWAGGSSIRRCRGWPSRSCARGSRTGEPRRGVAGPERSEGNSEGPRRGSPCPVAGTGHAGSGAGAPGPASGHPRHRQERLHAVEEEPTGPSDRPKPAGHDKAARHGSADLQPGAAASRHGKLPPHRTLDTRVWTTPGRITPRTRRPRPRGRRRAGASPHS